MNHTKALFLVALLGFSAVLVPAWADSSAPVAAPQAGATNNPPSFIAILPFSQPDGIGVDLSSVVDVDLSATGAFRTIPRQYLGNALTVTAQKEVLIDFEGLKALGAEYAVTGTVLGNNLRLMMFDVKTGEAILALDLPGLAQNVWRYLAHEASDLIYKKLTGEAGAASTLMVYVVANGSGDSRKFDLIVNDIDGANPHVIAMSREPIMSPSWSPDGKQLAFVGYEHQQQSIYVYTRKTGALQKLISEPGINGSPAWSPDGKSIAVTLSMKVNPDIYIVDIESGSRRRLTDAPGVDTEPAWSPDGSTIIFTSDRSGQPQIYQVPVFGGEPHLLTKVGKQNLRASYSPDGKTITFVTYQAGVYRIALMDLGTGVVKILSDGPLDESPSFSPNGRAILYCAGTREGSNKLMRTSVDGRVRIKMQLPDNANVHEPAWSPLRK